MGQPEKQDCRSKSSFIKCNSDKQSIDIFTYNLGDVMRSKNGSQVKGISSGAASGSWRSQVLEFTVLAEVPESSEATEEESSSDSDSSDST